MAHHQLQSTDFVSDNHTLTFVKLKLIGLVKVDCGHPIEPTNGTLSLTNGTHYDADVYFECNIGFTILGNKSSVCQQSGQWEPGTPHCQLIGDNSL